MYAYLFLSLGNIFMLGAYTSAVVFNMQKIETYQWVLTSLFSIIFIKMFIYENRNQRRIKTK